MKKITKQILVLTLGLSALTSLALFAYDAPLYPPGAPGKVKIVDYGKDWCEITWKAPSHDGGSPITCYRTEKLDLSCDSKQWIFVGKTTPDVKHDKIMLLLEDHTYQFRVRAENAIGPGEFSEESASIGDR